METRRTLKVEYPTDNDAKNVAVFVVGQTGSGKTVLLYNLARGSDRVVVFDMMREYGKLGVPCNQLVDLVRLLEDGHAKIVYQPPISEDGDYNDQINTCVAIVEDFQAQNPELGEVVFVMDEVSRVSDVNHFPSGLKELLQRGRHYRIHKMLGIHFLSRFPAVLRDCGSDWYVFRQVDPRAFRALAEMGWPDEIVEQVSTLPDLTCIHFDGRNFEFVVLQEKRERDNDAMKRRRDFAFLLA